METTSNGEESKSRMMLRELFSLAKGYNTILKMVMQLWRRNRRHTAANVPIGC
ncbi:MAG: hypothetical protein ICV81_14100 [Flavisolibacter sp.]|nr:hypothetical protein [Flavisolibacter sp.]